MCRFIVIVLLLAAAPCVAQVQGRMLSMESLGKATWDFEGEMGRRIDANVSAWILRAPDASPGMIEMFHRRDRRLPYPEPVPWAGEFAGKYLISAVQACRMSDDPRLRDYVTGFVRDLLACQAEDGYLGPWPKDQRLLGHWDLWGHYHCMLGLMLWHDISGDDAALDAVVRAADAIAAVYGEGGRRPIEAGTPEVNLALIHGLGQLYRRVAKPEYLTVMHRIVEDMDGHGDWYALGAKGVPYHELPAAGPRWESLHHVQGFIELYRITGEESYADAARNLWRSIVATDRHPSGAFSTHERAYGTVYEPGAIETCCSVAWEALSVDVLKLTGDPTVADELELTTWNQVLGAQHPSGSWWTYDTPLDGVRVPSFETIRFQIRPGTPELNCCSVNAPRGLGMLSEWAVMLQGVTVVVNYYGPGTCTFTHPTAGKVALRQETVYPRDGRVRIVFETEKPVRFPVRLRIPAWSKQTGISFNNTWDGPPPLPGTYFDIESTWSPGDFLELDFDMSPRFWVGREGRHGRAALYRGPLLLAFDALYNELETNEIPPLEITEAELTPFEPAEVPGRFAPLGLWSCPTADGREVVLCDFATAGAHGTDYVSWLPMAHVPPPPATLSVPRDGRKGTPGPVLFSWATHGLTGYRYELVVARDPGFSDVVVRENVGETNRITLAHTLVVPGEYFWKVRTLGEEQAVDNDGGPRRLEVAFEDAKPFYAMGPEGLLAAAPLAGDGTPSFGVCELARRLKAAKGRAGMEGEAVSFDGVHSGLRFGLPFFPEDDYTFAAWVCPEDTARTGFQQVFSAWCIGGDDPLRVTLDGGMLHARIEAGAFHGTDGVPVKDGEWVHVAAVKAGASLTLYVNGAVAQRAAVPERVGSRSTAIGVGFNPLLPGGEYFRGRISDFAFWAEARTAGEVAALASEGTS